MKASLRAAGGYSQALTPLIRKGSHQWMRLITDYRNPRPNHAQRRAMGRAVRVLAIREAIKAVKQRMHAEGLKVHHVPRKIIVAAADDYLANYRSELVAEATKIVERCTLRERLDREEVSAAVHK